MSSRTSRWRKLAQLGPGERRLLLEAPLRLPQVALALRRRRLADVQEDLAGRVPDVTPSYSDPAAARDAARRIAWVVQVGAAGGPWPANCLQRSVVCWWFLRRRGLDSELRIGVRRARDGDGMQFHAWVERDGEVLNDRPDVVSTYAVFDRATAPRNAHFD